MSSEKATASIMAMKTLVREVMISIEKMVENPGAIIGLATGFRDLDKLTLGLRSGSIFVIAARPSMGKTALALNIAANVAIDQNIPVGVFSLDLSAGELVTRMLSSRSEVNLRALRDGLLTEKDCKAIATTASKLVEVPICFDDTPGLTINQVRARARRMHQQYKIQLLVIDHLQLIKTPPRRTGESSQVTVADASLGIKALAEELSIPIILLCHLNGQPEYREDGEPRLDDLRHFGSTEQAADIVGLLVRPEIYEESEEGRKKLKGQAQLIIAKNRSGAIGDVSLRFLSEYTRFEDVTRVGSDDSPTAQTEAK